MEKAIEALQELFREFHLNKQSTLGAHCHEVRLFLRELGERIRVVERDQRYRPRVHNEAIHDLEQLRGFCPTLEKVYSRYIPDKHSAPNQKVQGI